MKLIQAVHSVRPIWSPPWDELCPGFFLNTIFLACFSKMPECKPAHVWCGTRTLEISKERSKWHCWHILSTSIRSMKTVNKVSFLAWVTAAVTSLNIMPLRLALGLKCREAYIAYSWYCSNFTRDQVNLVTLLWTDQYSSQNFAGNGEHQYATLIAML